MCGRFTQALPWSEVVRILRAEAPATGPERRFNVAPTQQVAVLVLPNDGGRRLRAMRWGLVPSWARDPSIGNKLINARAETLAEKPSFRDAFRLRRCLVVATGFYEWKKGPAGKVPIWIGPRDGGLLTFAGLWETWRGPDGKDVESCTIVTTSANELLGAFHERMPVIVPPDSRDRWIAPGPVEPAALADLLVPYPSDLLVLREASPRVNSPANEGEDLLPPG